MATNWFFIALYFTLCSHATFLNLYHASTSRYKLSSLVEIAKKLPEKQWNKLKEEVAKEVLGENKPNTDFIKLLLSGPTFSEEQLAEIAETRKAINLWRTK